VEYAEYAPSPRLSNVLRCIWTLGGQVDDLATAAQPILPDGRSEIIIHLGDPFERILGNGAVERQPDAIFAASSVHHWSFGPLEGSRSSARAFAPTARLR
jgi:hypothetical protein